MPKNELQKFTSVDFGEIRGVSIDGEPWLVGKDVAEKLGYKNTKDALSVHVDDEDKKMLLRSQNPTLEIPNRGMTIVNESGFYSLVFGSKLPNAKQFKHWVTHEVLPQIRKTGGYIPVKPNDTKEDIVKRDNDILRKTIEAQNSIISMTHDGFVKYTKWMDADGFLSLGQTAKILGLGRTTMDDRLVEHKVLFRSGGFVLPYSTYEKRKYFKVKAYTACGGRAISQTFVTPKGMDFIGKVLEDK